MIQNKIFSGQTPFALGAAPRLDLPRSKILSIPHLFARLRWFGKRGYHLVTIEQPSFSQSGGHFRPCVRCVLVAFRWAGSAFVAVRHSLTVFFRRGSAPSAIARARKKIALALALSAGVCNASFYEATFSVKLFSANDAIEVSAIHAVGTGAGASHVASIEKPREFGETLNINDTAYPVLSQYRAKHLAKADEGVTTNVWSLTRESGTAVKRHERAAQAQKASDEIVWTAGRPVDVWIKSHTITFDSDWDLLNISASDVISAAEYQWRQVALNVVASGRELRINSGDSRIINLAKAKIKNALRTFNNNFSSDMYSSGSLTNQVNGLQSLIADTNTNTVGGIDANTWTFWRNTVIDASVLGVTPSATTIEGGLMLPAWLATDRGPDDQVDLIVMDNTYYGYFESSQVSMKRYNDTSKGDAGFVTLKYKNADVIYDGNSGIPTEHAYFVNTQYLDLVVHQDADLEIMDDMRPINQDGSVTPILWMGNLTCSNRKQQAVIHA